MRHKGFFIALEGTEGAGKSTQREYMEKFYKNEGFEVVLTREPGGTPLAEQIRELLLMPRDEPVAKKAELALFYAARIQHIEQVIKPALARGAIVICDRFVDSSYAYQMAGRELKRKVLDDLNDWAIGDFRPDLTFLFEISPETGLKRASARGRLDRFESEGRDYFERVALGYLGQYNRDPCRYALINADQPREAVWAEVEPHAKRIAESLRNTTYFAPAQNLDTQMQVAQIMLSGTEEQQEEAQEFLQSLKNGQ